MIKGRSHMKYNSYESIRDLYYKYFTTTKPFQDVGYENNEDDKLSFKLQNYLYFYIEMHKLSGSNEWISLIEETCDHILDNTDERRFSKGELTLTPLETPPVDTNYFQAPYPYQLNGTPTPGWSSFDGSEQPRLRAQVLQDGQIVAALCEVAMYIIEGSITTTAGFANKLLSHSRLVIDSHDRSYRYNSTVDGVDVAGAYKYPERIDGGDSVYGDPVPYNHCAGINKAMLICDKYQPNAEYMNKANSFMEFTRNQRSELDGAFLWSYSLKTPDKAEDLNHATYTIDFLYTAYKLGKLEVTREELSKYANSLVNANKWPNVKNAFERIDRTRDISTAEKFDVGCLAYLGDISKPLLYFGRDLSSCNYIAKYHAHFRSIATLLNNLENHEL